MDRSAYQQMARTEERHWWFRGRRRVIEAMLRHQLEPGRARRVLEIGAGTGGNLAMLAQFGTLSATEMDDEARRLASERTQVVVRAGALPDGLPAFEAPFDLVCLFDVLEHVDDDFATLVTIRRLLAPGGCFILTVPAYAWMWSTHDEILHHKRRYRRGALRALIERAGFEVQRCTYFNTLLFPAAALGRLLDALRKAEQPSGVDLPAPPINAVLARIFGAEAHLLPYLDLPFGVSLLAVMRAR